MGWILSKGYEYCRGQKQPVEATEAVLAVDPVEQIPDDVRELALPPNEEEHEEVEIDWETVDNETARLTIKHLFNIVCDQLHIDLRDLFMADLITNTQYQQLPRLDKYEGPTAMNSKLLEYVLEGQQAKQFIQSLRQLDSNVYQQLIPVLLQVQRGQIKVHGGVVEELQYHLMQTYKGFNIITALIGEKFIIDVDDDLRMMPVHFSAQKLEKDEREQGHLQREHVTAKYTNVEYNSIEKLVSALGNEHESNVVQITANAGTGKTVAVHRIVCQWVSDFEKKLLGSLLGNQYSLVFFIALRDVNLDYSLLEMCCEGKNKLGYIPNHIKLDEVEQILQNPQTASKILILLDGLDEKTIPESSQIFQLITGKRYPNVKVLYTSRPEALILSKLNNINPMFKVQLYGTTKEGVYQYLHKTIKASEEDVDKLIKQCELKMVDFHILKIPIYLTIIGYVFDDFWSRNLSFQQFIVPDTVTKLFNIFMNILLRVWLEKLGRKEEAAELQFYNNPVGRNSRVPRDIRSKLVLFGKLSFYSLIDESYDFKDCDLEKYLISESDISQCGMFCFAMSGDSSVYFYRHKQIQEYMGGLYLSHEQFNDRAFTTDILEHSLSKTGEQATLLHIFRKVPRVMPFLFGLAPGFAAEILHKLNGVAKIYGDINLHYEALLCAEACNQQVTELMGDLVISADVIKNNDYKFVSPLSSMYKLCTGLSTKQHKTLLQKWYDLKLHKIEPDSTNNIWDITAIDSENRILKLKSLNEVLYFMLCNYIFPNVQSLNVNWSHICHPGIILRVFPSLTRLVIGFGQVPVLDENLVSVIPQCVTHNTSLTHLTVSAGFPITLSQCTVSCLLSLSQLTTLILHGDMLTNLDFSCDIHLPHLHTMQMGVGKLTDSMCAGLTHILKDTPQLTVFSLMCYNNLSTTQTVPFLQQLTTLPQLHTLVLHKVIRQYDMPVVCDTLQHMTGLVTLGLGYLELHQHGEYHIAPHITQFYVMYDEISEKYRAESVVESLTEHCPPCVQVNSYQWNIAQSIL